MKPYLSILSIRPHGAESSSPQCLADLRLDQIFDAVTAGATDDTLRQLFTQWAWDDDEVNYRHEVFADLEEDANRLPVEEFIRAISTVQTAQERAVKMWHPRQRQGWTLHAIGTYCAAVTRLQSELRGTILTSRGLRQFRTNLDEYCASDEFLSLRDGTSAVQDALSQIRYTVNIRELTVDVDTYRDEPDYSADVANLFERFHQHDGRDYRIHFPDYPDMNHVEEQILDRVAALHPEIFTQLAEHCERHSDFIDTTLDQFTREARFYLCYLAFMARFTEAGLSFCYPTVSPNTNGIYADDAFDLALAIKQLHQRTLPICNDFHLAERERVIIVTGPNQGGKTTFARTIGQLCYLAALGCPVPASRAALRFPDHIFTHFERQENIQTLHGKLDDELQRIHQILAEATDRSVLVMNESFSSTTVDDALRISSEILRRVDEIGCIAVYVSFLDELTELLPSCVSMVGGVAEDDPTVRTFRFTRRPADGLAYAAALTDKYGLSPEILTRRVHP